MLKVNLGVTIFIVVGASLLMMFLLEESNRRAIFDPEGSAQDGVIFGIAIGTEATGANEQLSRRGFEPGESARAGYCLGRKLTDDGTADLYVRTGWPHGVVCVFFQLRHCNGRELGIRLV